MSVFKTFVSRNLTHSRRKAAISRATALVRGANVIEQLENRQLMAATLTLVNPDLLPGTNRLIFNTVQNPDTSVPNVVHNEQTLQITDTGTDPLVISSVAVSGPWTLVGAPTGGYTNVTVNPGTPLNLTLLFTQNTLPAHTYNETNYTTNPNGGAAITGALTINSNDATTPSNVVTLAGYWQNLSNNNEEPGLQTITNLLAGYQTNINSSPIPDLTEPNGVQTYGSEITATSWEPANAAVPVSLQQLGAFRTEGNNATLYWYTSSDQVSHKLFTDAANQGQTLLPTLSDGSLAVGSFTPTGAFGFRVDNEYSTDSINVAAGNSGGGGHHFRFFPLVDNTGKTIANSYIVTMDYGTLQTENFDFQDNVFVVNNIRPSGTPETPSNFTATNGAAPVLSWTADTYSPVSYNVYSSTTATGTYSLLTPTPITTTTFTDTSNAGTPVYYRLTALDTTQSPIVGSFPASTSSNVGPVTVADALTTYTGTPVTFNPLANDSDTTGTLVASSVATTTPNHGGTALVNTGNGLITYTPAAGFTGTETFNYTVTDTNGLTSAATPVTVVVSSPVITAPVANNLVVTDLVNTPIQINELAVDLPVTSFNPSTVTFTLNPTAGNVVVNADGSVTYTPSRNFVGGDVFNYTVADANGQVSNTAVVNINVGAEISSAKGAIHTLVYTDENGTPVTVGLNSGVTDVFFDGTGTLVSSLKGKTTIAGSGLRAREITLTGTSAASVLKISGARGAQFNLGGIVDASPLGAVVAPGANLRALGTTSLLGLSTNTGSLVTGATLVATATPAAGVINLAGVRSISLRTANAGKLVLGGAGVSSTSIVFAGTITDTPITSVVPISTLKARAYVKSATDIMLLSAPSIANLSTVGEFDPDLTLTGAARGFTLGTAHIGGTVKVGNWTVTGNVHSVYMGAVDPSWGGISVTGNLASMVVASGNLTADVVAQSINSLKVAGVLSSDVKTTGNLLSLQAGQLVGAFIDVGSSATSIADATLANLGGATLKSLRLTSRAANTFSDSSVVADVIGSAITGPINAAGTTEGFATHVFKSATLTIDNGVVHVPAKDLVSNAVLAGYLSSRGLTLGTFAINIL